MRQTENKRSAEQVVREANTCQEKQMPGLAANFFLHKEQIRCVLSDLTMPRMNGWETLTALRKLQPDIPVILTSGYDKTHVMEGDHPELPQAFLAKPYNLKALQAAISQTLESKKK